MTDITATYRQHLQERKEAAFAKWQASGYRDTAAWIEFISAMTKLGAKQ